MKKRVSRACNACARRKIRCDRRGPCQSCLQRNMGRYCSNYVSNSIEPSFSSTQAQNAEVTLLKERLAFLEEQLAQSHIQIDQYPSSPQLVRESDHDGASHQFSSPNLDTLQGAIENLNLGLDQEHSASDLPNAQILPFDIGLSPLLPSYTTSDQIVRFSLSQLGWIHCALRASSFIEEHLHFWRAVQTNQKWEPGHSSWFALYFAILCTGLYFMDMDERCFVDFSFHDSSYNASIPRYAAEAEDLSHLWYRESLAELDRSDFTGKARWHTIQTVAILTLVNNSFGENEREWILMGASINIARSLSLDMLGSGKCDGQANLKVTQPNHPEDRALGRRLWWTLVICDWLGSMNRFPNIQPDSFDSRLEPHAFAEDVILQRNEIVESPNASVSCLLYHETMAKLAHVLRSYIKAGRGASPSNRASAMSEVETIANELPPHLQRDPTEQVSIPSQGSLYSWILMQRYLVTHVLQFVRLTIARASFAEWLNRRPDEEGFHRKAIESAEILVAEKSRGLSPMYQKSWIVCASTVAAGIFLGLDLLCFSTGEGQLHARKRKDAIRICIDSLEALGSTNIISRRGPAVLKKLLALDATWDYKSVPTSEKLSAIVKHISVTDDHGEQQLSPSAWPNTFQTVVKPTADTEERIFSTAREHHEDVFDTILTNNVFDDVEFEMETFENPFSSNDAVPEHKYGY